MKKCDRRATLRLGMECVMALSAKEVIAAGTPPLELDARALPPLVPKAGGGDSVAYDVFWIHHEEERGQWNWSGQRDLRRVWSACCGADRARMAERNGGLPDWVQNNKAYKIRSTDPGFMADTRRLYEQIAAQTRNAPRWRCMQSRKTRNHEHN